MSDNISLMFAIEAEQLILAGLPDEAIGLCIRGLEVYPGYASAISVLAKAYAALGDKDKAEEIIESTKEDVPIKSYHNIKESLNSFDLSVLESISSKIDNTIIDEKSASTLSEFDYSETENSNFSLENNQIDLNDSVSHSDNDFQFDTEFINEESDITNNDTNVNNYDFLSDDLSSKISESKPQEILEITNITTLDSSKEISSIQSSKSIRASNLSIIPGLERYIMSGNSILFSSSKPIHKEKVMKLIKKQSDFISIISSLSKAEVIKSEYYPKNDRHKSSVVITETIAGILVQQGAYSEAKTAYQELIKKYPDKKKIFKKKIAEIDAKIK